MGSDSQNPVCRRWSHWVTLVLYSTVATGQQGLRAVVESVWHMFTEAHVGQELTSIRNWVQPRVMVSSVFCMYFLIPASFLS